MLQLPLAEKASIFLLGPRGTGKTQWVKTHLPTGLYLDLLEFDLYKDLMANPGRLEKIIPPSFADWIVLDEVQRIPALLHEVHRLIEARHFKFLLTGSSARTLKRKGVNLLAGRALRYHMYPLIVQELGEDFDLLRALEFGLLPGAMGIANPQKYLETYVQTYLREEVLQEGLTRNISAFSRFLEIASFSQGSILNISEIAREVGIDRQVIKNYFSIVDDLLIGYHIQPFTKRAKRRLVLHAKFYFFDTGVYRILRPKGPLDSREEIDGAGLETLFLQSLLAVNDYYHLGYTIYFWRSSSGQEVDFIAYGAKGFHAFEIKRTTNITSKSLKGLEAFHEDYPEASLYLLYTGDRREYHNNINVIPIETALADLLSILGG